MHQPRTYAVGTLSTVIIYSKSKPKSSWGFAVFLAVKIILSEIVDDLLVNVIMAKAF